MKALETDTPGVDYHDCPKCGEHVPSGVTCLCGKLWVGGPNADRQLADEHKRLALARMKNGLVMVGLSWRPVQGIIWPDENTRSGYAAEYRNLGFHEVAAQIEAGQTIDHAVASAYQRGMEAAGFIPNTLPRKQKEDEASERRLRKATTEAYARGVTAGAEAERKRIAAKEQALRDEEERKAAAVTEKVMRAPPPKPPTGPALVKRDDLDDVAFPRFASVSEWCRLSGMGRTITYQHVAHGNLKMVKMGSRSLIDVHHGLKWVESLPAAKLNPKAYRKTGSEEK